MDLNQRENNIKAIIKLEDRIFQCRRCPSLLHCSSKPGTGKGDLVPEAVIVFECENEHNTDIDWVVEMRNTVQKYLQVNAVYHSFLVRCHPKACWLADTIPCRVNDPLLKADNTCRLSKKNCTGIPVKPTDEAILNCLNYIIEELAIFQPENIILFGRRVSEFVLKAYGILDTIQDRLVYHHEGTTFITIMDDQFFHPSVLKSLTDILDTGHQE